VMAAGSSETYAGALARFRPHAGPTSACASPARSCHRSPTMFPSRTTTQPTRGLGVVVYSPRWPSSRARDMKAWSADVNIGIKKSTHRGHREHRGTTTRCRHAHSSIAGLQCRGTTLLSVCSVLSVAQGRRRFSRPACDCAGGSPCPAAP
jgi:hypothetical protein